MILHVEEMAEGCEFLFSELVDAYSRFTKRTHFHPQGRWCRKKPCSSGFPFFFRHWVTFVIAIRMIVLWLFSFFVPDLCWNHKNPMNSHMDHAPKMHLTWRLWKTTSRNWRAGWVGSTLPKLPEQSWIPSSESPVFPLGAPPFSGELFVKLWDCSKGCGQNPVSLVQVWYFKGYNLDTPPVN